MYPYSNTEMAYQDKVLTLNTVEPLKSDPPTKRHNRNNLSTKDNLGGPNAIHAEIPLYNDVTAI